MRLQPRLPLPSDPGLWAALGAAFLWGLLPLYWKTLDTVPAMLILAHRILWSCIFLVPLVILTGRMGEVTKAAKNVKTMLGLTLSSLILGNNWLLFIWAVNQGRILETSLGYYINPLITICLGVVFLRDRPSRTRWIAIIIAFIGVTAEVIINGVVPWVALGLAFLFAFYALARKLAPVESLPGLCLETFIIMPLALGYILWSDATAPFPAWGSGTGETLLLMGTGVITSVPLILYGYGARHLPFTTLGILQYISPTCSFLIALFVFGEAFTFGRAISFTCIWIALALYTWDSIRARHAKPHAKQSGGA